MKGIIFDCDGVLFDTLQANTIYYNIVREQVGLPPLTKEEEEYSYSATVQESLEYATPKEKIPAIVEATKKTPYLQTALPYISIDKDLVPLLTKLKASGKSIGIFTNRTKQGVIDIIEHFNIAQFFSILITCDDVTPKPSPEGLYKISQSWGIPLEELLFVGDSMADYGAAQQTKVHMVAFRNRKIPSQYHVQHFSELEALIGV